MTTTRIRLRTVAAGAVAALLISPLAACGADEEKSPATDGTAESSASAEPTTETTDGGATEAATDGEPASGGTITTENFAEVLTSAIAEHETAHITMTMGAALDAEGDVRYADGGNEMKMTMAMGQQEATMIFVDDALYMQMPGMTQPGKWMKVTGDDPAMGAMIDQMDGMGPEASLEVMKKGLQDVRFVGEEGGLDHYEVTVDTAAAMESLGELGGAGTPSGMPDQITYDLYVDDDNLMRKVVMNVMDQQMVMEVTEWGNDVDIEAPPASDVVSMPGTRR